MRLLILLFVLPLTVFAGGHHHHEKEHTAVSVVEGERIHVSDAWVRAMPPGSKMSAAYMTLNNVSDETLTLVAAKSDIATNVEVHVSREVEGVMEMKQVEGVVVAPKEKKMLKPGGYHVMFIGLTRDLVEGEEVAVTLEFDNGSQLDLVAPIKKSKMKTGHHHHH